MSNVQVFFVSLNTGKEGKTHSVDSGQDGTILIDISHLTKIECILLEDYRDA